MPLTAQTSMQLHGKVVDTNGRAVASEPVRVETARGSLVTETATDERGLFTFTGKPASYIVRMRFDTPDGPVGIADVRLTDFGGETAPTFVACRMVASEPCAAPVPSVESSSASANTVVPQQPAPALPAEGVRRSPVASAGRWEYGVQVSGGVGLQDRSNYSFLNAGAHAGKVLTPNFGSGLLQADFEYGVEVVPFWQSYTPTFQRLNCPTGAVVAAQCKGPTTSGGTYRGVSVVPIELRLNFTHGERWMPWVQGAGGVLYTTRKYPGIGSLNVADPTMTGPAADTSVWNFTPQFGVGAHYFLKPRRSLDFSANAVHISSASLGDKNPGVNTSVQFAVGYSWWK